MILGQPHPYFPRCIRPIAALWSFIWGPGWGRSPPFPRLLLIPSNRKSGRGGYSISRFLPILGRKPSRSILLYNGRDGYRLAWTWKMTKSVIKADQPRCSRTLITWRKVPLNALSLALLTLIIPKGNRIKLDHNHPWWLWRFRLKLFLLSTYTTSIALCSQNRFHGAAENFPSFLRLGEKGGPH